MGLRWVIRWVVRFLKIRITKNKMHIPSAVSTILSLVISSTFLLSAFGQATDYSPNTEESPQIYVSGNDIICKELDIKDNDDLIIVIPDNYHAVFPKCCPPGQSYSSIEHDLNQTDGASCTSSSGSSRDFGINISVICNNNMLQLEEIYYPKNLIYRDPCKFDKFALSKEDGDKFGININGKLYWRSETEQKYTIMDKSQYCLEKIDDVMTVFVCFDDDSPLWRFYLYAGVEVVSVIFLYLTFAIYIFIKKLRKTIQSHVLLWHVFCLQIAFTELITIQLIDQSWVPHDVCIVAGYTIQFSFLAAFFWLTVMCFETYQRCLNDQVIRSRRKTLLRYHIGVWSSVILILIITIILQFTPMLPSSLGRPGIGNHSCWFDKKVQALWYFYLPVTISLVINIVLFVKTCRQISKDTPRSFVSLSRKCLILSSTMGLYWITEVVSWAASDHIPLMVMIALDVANAAQGVVIFLLFVVPKWSDIREEAARRRFLRRGISEVKEQDDFDLKEMKNGRDVLLE